MITTATKGDWDNFWYSPETDEAFTSEEFSKIWKEMDEIEPLTPHTKCDSDYQI